MDPELPFYKQNTSHLRKGLRSVRHTYCRRVDGRDGLNLFSSASPPCVYPLVLKDPRTFTSRFWGVTGDCEGTLFYNGSEHLATSSSGQFFVCDGYIDVRLPILCSAMFTNWRGTFNVYITRFCFYVRINHLSLTNLHLLAPCPTIYLIWQQFNQFSFHINYSKARKNAIEIKHYSMQDCSAAKTLASSDSFRLVLNAYEQTWSPPVWTYFVIIFKVV